MVATLILAGVVMITLGGYLLYLQSEYRIAYRIYYHSSALPIAEAGIEDGFAMLNYGNTNWSGNGWSTVSATNHTKVVTNFFHIGNTVVAGSYSVSCVGTTTNLCTLVSTGTVNATSATLLGAVNTNITRVVQVTVKPRGTFTGAVAAKTSVSISNGNIDSFDSSDPTHADFSGGLGYGIYDPTKNKDNGDIAANASSAGAISLGNGLVYGHANTSPTGTVTVSGGFLAALGQATNGVIDTSRVTHTATVTPPDGALPGDFSAVTDLGSVGSSLTLVGGAGAPVDYTADKVTVGGGKWLKFSGGYTRLYVLGDFTISGSGYSELLSDSTVEIYVGGKITISGGGIANDVQRAGSFALVSLGSGSVTLSGSSVTYATIYSPESAITISGSGSLVGAIVGDTFSLTGGMTIHYDEALGNSSSGSNGALTWLER